MLFLVTIESRPFVHSGKQITKFLSAFIEYLTNITLYLKYPEISKIAIEFKKIKSVIYALTKPTGGFDTMLVYVNVFY